MRWLPAVVLPLIQVQARQCHLGNPAPVTPFNLLFKMNLWREVDVGVVVDKFAKKKTLSGILKRIIKCYVEIYKF